MQQQRYKTLLQLFLQILPRRIFPVHRRTPESVSPGWTQLHKRALEGSEPKGFIYSLLLGHVFIWGYEFHKYPSQLARLAMSCQMQSIREKLCLNWGPSLPSMQLLQTETPVWAPAAPLPLPARSPCPCISVTVQNTAQTSHHHLNMNYTQKETPPQKLLRQCIQPWQFTLLRVKRQWSLENPKQPKDSQNETYWFLFLLK